MSWIKIQNGLVSNRKTARLAREMKWSKMQTIGFLISFWVWAIENCEDGQLKDTTDTEIDFAVGVENVTGIVDALIISGFVDKEPFRIHDWPEHQCEFLRGKHRKTPEKLERIFDLYRSSTGAVPEFARIDRKKERKIDIKKEGEEAQTPPSILEVRALAEAEGLKSDPDKFFHWQESKAWAGVIEWQAAFRYWCRSEYKDKPEVPKTQPSATVGAWQPPESYKTVEAEQCFHGSAIKDGKCIYCKGAEVPVMGCNCEKYGAELAKYKITVMGGR